MPKDVLIFGGLAGIVGNLVKETVAWVLYWLGFLKYTFVHLCAGIVIPHSYLKEPLAILIGVLLDFTVAACFGLVYYYIYICAPTYMCSRDPREKSGSDYYLVKGFGFGTVVFLLCYGIFCPLFSINLSQPPFTVFLYLVVNLLYGLTTSVFVKKYAPDNNHKQQGGD